MLTGIQVLLGSVNASYNTLILFCSKDLEEEGEDISYIHIEVESSKDILFWTYGVPLVPHQKLGVKHQKLQKKNVITIYTVVVYILIYKTIYCLIVFGHPPR